MIYHYIISYYITSYYIGHGGAAAPRGRLREHDGPRDIFSYYMCTQCDTICITRVHHNVIMMLICITGVQIIQYDIMYYDMI